MRTFLPPTLMPMEERQFVRHIDVRLWSTYALFHFLGVVFSCDTLGKGKSLGRETSAVLMGQLIETWRMRWNESNKRVCKRVRWLLSRVYKKIVRAHGISIAMQP